MPLSASIHDFISLTVPSLGPCPDVLPCPYTSAPDGHALAAQKAYMTGGFLPSGFNGRVGLLLVAQNNIVTAHFATRALTSKAQHPWHMTHAADLWPGLEACDVPSLEMMNGLGETKTLQALIDEVFAPFPQRDDDHGGREQAVRRALWRGFLLDGILSPSVQLLLAFNASLAKGEYALTKARPRMIGLTEWWVGDSPSWDIRFHETFYAPSSGARFILAFALMGHPHEEAKPQQDPNDLPSLPILYEDEHLVVINKPARLSSVPGGSETVSAKSILEATYGELFVIHRLDMGTSGVLAFAKTKDALRPLNKAFSDRNAHKTYVARLEGTIMSTNGTISLPIALNWFDRPKQAILPTTEGGRDAVTTYRVLETVNTASGPKTLVELSPITGRTHQLRMHCAHPEGLNCPIDGDPFYGHGGLKEEARTRRLCLHAASLSIVHPMTGEPLTVVAPAAFPDF